MHPNKQSLTTNSRLHWRRSRRRHFRRRTNHYTIQSKNRGKNITKDA